MRRRLISILQYVIFLGGGLFLAWWQLKSMTEPERQEFFNALKHANYWIVIPITLMSIASHLSRSMRWKLLMKPLGFNPKIKNVFAVTMVGYLANAAIPRLGEVLKCSLLARYEKLQTDKLIGTIIVERSFDLICYLIFISLTILIQLEKISEFFKQQLSSMSEDTGTPVWLEILIYAVAIYLFIKIIRLLLRKFPENKMIVKTNNAIKGIGIGFKSIKNLQDSKLFLLHTVFIWLMYLLQIYLGFKAMDGTDHLSIKAAFSVLSLATLAMIITPGGIGSFPIFVMETLSIYAIALPVGKAFGWVIWGVSTGLTIIIGLICLVALPYINRILHQPTQQTNNQL